MGHIVVVGSANTDMILKCDRLPGPGETVLGGHYIAAAGGKGANQAVAAARLGAEVVFVARLGRDWLGDQALAHYTAEGVRCDHLTRDDDLPSGVALIMVDAAGENLIGVAPGANGALRPEHVEQAAPAFQGASVLLVQLEIPLDTVGAALRLAHQHGVRAILNPAPARPLPDELIRGAILTPNETEAGQLTDRTTDAKAAAQRLLERGAANVIVTLGEKGALVSEPGGFRAVPGFRVQAVDTTAAGDAFNGGLACALARGVALPEAVRYANAVAALSVTRLGAQPSLPIGDEVTQFLNGIAHDGSTHD
jgi:ribokinase